MLLPRTPANTPHASAAPTCISLQPGDIILSRSSFIVSITLCAVLTCISLLALSTLLYRAHARRLQDLEAKTWGRKSRYLKRVSHMNRLNYGHNHAHNHSKNKHGDNRISLARKEVDRSFSSKYRGCLVNLVENPELGSESPVEMMGQREGVFEVPARPVRAVVMHDEDVGW